MYWLLHSLESFHCFTSMRSATACDEEVYLYTRTDGRLFNNARLCAKTKVRRILTREHLFADDTVFVYYSVIHLQRLVDRFAYACKEFGLTIMAQDSDMPPVITIDG